MNATLNEREKKLRTSLETATLLHTEETKLMAVIFNISESELKNKIAEKVQQVQQVQQAKEAKEAQQARYARIIENTKFEQAEQLQLEGFPANNYIYCIEPATGDPNSFDVGTYGMII